MGDEGRSCRGFSFFAFLIGAAAGACLGLLTAPAAGRETRKRIRDTSEKAKERVVGTAQRVTETAKEGFHKYADLGKEQIHDTAQNLKAAVDAGKQAYKAKKGEIASGVSHTEKATDPDDNDDTA